MSFGGPPNRRPSSLPRSSSFSAPSRGNSRSVQAGRATEGEPSRGWPRRPSGRDNAPLQSRHSISLNSPRSPEPFDSQNSSFCPSKTWILVVTIVCRLILWDRSPNFIADTSEKRIQVYPPAKRSLFYEVPSFSLQKSEIGVSVRNTLWYGK